MRYLGCQNNADNTIISLVESSVNEINTIAKPRSIYQVYNTKFDANVVSFATFKSTSKDIINHLRNCEKVVLFAATLGVDIDRLLRTTTITNISRAVILQAAAAAVIEEYCNDVCDKEISALPELETLKLTSRFSPGYGDLKLDCQQNIIDILNAKKIGLSCTSSMMLAPSKSITAIIGAGANANCVKHKCSSCNKIDCLYRKG